MCTAGQRVSLTITGVSAPSRNLVPGIVVLEEALTLIPDIVFGGETDLHLGIVA